MITWFPIWCIAGNLTFAWCKFHGFIDSSAAMEKVVVCALANTKLSPGTKFRTTKIFPEGLDSKFSIVRYSMCIYRIS